MKKGLAHDLTFWLRTKGDWVSKNDIGRIEFPTKKGGTYNPDTVMRTLRDLESRTIIAVKNPNDYSVYKYIPDYLRDLYIPTSIRNKSMWTDEKEMSRLLSLYGQKSS